MDDRHNDDQARETTSQALEPAPQAEPSEHEQVAAEPDRPPVGRIVAIVSLVGVAVLGAVMLLWQVFQLDATAEVFRKNLSQDNPELRELRAREQGELSDYAQLDAGQYRIPIERAMEWLVREPDRLAPLAQPETPSSPQESNQGNRSSPAAPGGQGPSGALLKGKSDG